MARRHRQQRESEERRAPNPNPQRTWSVRLPDGQIRATTVRFTVEAAFVAPMSTADGTTWGVWWGTRKRMERLLHEAQLGEILPVEEVT